MARATRTINPLHFQDLEPHRFEDLVRQLAYSFRPWRSLEATGRRGNDEGVDIRGWERVEPSDDPGDADATEDATSDREWRIQVKRHKSLGPADLRRIVTEAVPPEGPSPYGLIIAAACDVSADALAVFRETAVAHGVVESHMWSNAHLEDSLFRPENDHLLFAYFGISITAKRRAQVAELRATLALKRKIRAAIDSKDEHKNRGLRQSFIVRDIDARYPDFENLDGQMRGYAPPWHAVTLREIHALGPVVERFHYEGIVMPDRTWDIREETRWWAANTGEYSNFFEEDDDPTRRQFAGAGVETPEKKMVTELRLIPWANVVDVDPAGDSMLSDPHLICRYDGDDGPYHGRHVFRAHVGASDRQLAETERRPLFAAETPTDPAPSVRRPRQRKGLIRPELTTPPQPDGQMDSKTKGRRVGQGKPAEARASRNDNEQ